MALDELTSQAAVDSALDEFDALGREAFLDKYGFGRARRYFVRRNGNYYDSKAIAGAAVGFEHPDRGPLTNTEFSGGEHGAKSRLEELGFEVVPRPTLAAADTLPLRDAIAAALAAQRNRVASEWSDDLQKAVAVTLPNAIRAVVGENFRVKGSAGAGNQAEVPWVSVLPPGTKGASEGRYIVYLFSVDGRRVFLALSQAVTGQPKGHLVDLAGTLRAAAGPQPDLLNNIDLGAQGSLGEKYALATAYAIKYEADGLPSAETLQRDLARFLEILDTVLDAPTTERPSWIFQANPNKYRIDEALSSRTEISWVVRQHAKEVRAGDRAYIWRAGVNAAILALATVMNDPESTPPDVDDQFWVDTDSFEKSEPRVRLRLDRVLQPSITKTAFLEHPVLRDLEIIRRAQGTNFRVSPIEEQALAELMGLDGVVSSKSLEAVCALPVVTADVAERLFLPRDWLQEIADLLDEKGQVIFYGPPGTGKTLVALELCKHLTAAGGDSRLVQFHPSYSYEDFFEGYRPVVGGGGGLEFSLTAGPLRSIARAANDDPSRPYFLVVDEINRGNIPKIFGELLFLLEYRNAEIYPQYSPQKPFTLPRNLYVIGSTHAASALTAVRLMTPRTCTARHAERTSPPPAPEFLRQRRWQSFAPQPSSEARSWKLRSALVASIVLGLAGTAVFGLLWNSEKAHRQRVVAERNAAQASLSASQTRLATTLASLRATSTLAAQRRAVLFTPRPARSHPQRPFATRPNRALASWLRLPARESVGR